MASATGSSRDAELCCGELVADRRPSEAARGCWDRIARFRIGRPSGVCTQMAVRQRRGEAFRPIAVVGTVRRELLIMPFPGIVQS